MRVHRIITAIIAFALIGFAPFATSSATAADNAIAPAVSSKPANVQVTARIVKTNGKLVMKGKVTPRKGPVIISKATRCNNQGVCNFKKFTEVGTNKQAQYQARVTAPGSVGKSFYWQARVGSNKSPIWRTFKTRG